MDDSGPAVNEKAARMVFVDALRGFAAFGVFFHHLTYTNRHAAIVREIVPAVVDAFANYGRYGVQIFFVISGFVIAHSLREDPVTPRSVGNFILRRQVRLDPPYWTMLVLILAWGLVTTPTFCFPPPWEVGTGEILANFVYLHRILGLADLLIVAWTLCLEIQFYLLNLLILALGRIICRGRRSSNVEATLLLITGIASVAYRVHDPQSAGDLYTWFPYGWCLFAGGALAELSIRDRRVDGHFRSFLMLFVAFYTLGGNSWQPDSVIGLSTIALLWGAGKLGTLTTWLRHGVFRYLGRTSYSLYLVHYPVMSTILAFGDSRAVAAGTRMSAAWFVAAGAAAFVAAHLLYVAVERPSMHLASSLKRRPRESKPAPDPFAAPAEGGTGSTPPTPDDPPCRSISSDG